MDDLFPYKGYIWSYGAIPQTWEDQDTVANTLAVVTITQLMCVKLEARHVCARGGIIGAKVLSMLAITEEEETLRSHCRECGRSGLGQLQ